WGGVLGGVWERGGLLQLGPAAVEREHLAGGGRAPFLRHCLDGLRFLWWRCHEPGRRVGWFDLGLGLGLVHRLGRGRRARPEQLVRRLPGPSVVPALATIDDAVGPVAARDTLWLTLHEVAAARDVNQRARNHQCDQSSSGSAPPHAVQVAGERGSIGAAASGVLREILQFSFLVSDAPQAPGPLTLFRREKPWWVTKGHAPSVQQALSARSGGGPPMNRVPLPSRRALPRSSDQARLPCLSARGIGGSWPG